MIICPKCGTRNKDRSLSCRNCGLYFSVEERQGGPGEIQQSPPKRIHQPNYLDIENPEDFDSGGRDRRPILLEDRIEQNLHGQRGNGSPAEQPYPYQPSAAGGGSSNKLLWGILAVVILMAAGLGYYIFYQPGNETATTASAVFAMAEDFYNEANYLAALKLYQQFLQEYPNNALAPIAKNKISEINNDLVSMEEKQQRVGELLQSAQSAFEKEQFLVPDEGNAVGYLSEILLLDPTNTEALEMQEKIISYYDDQASDAVKRRRYDAALQSYEKILAIVPNDRYATEQIARVQRTIEEQRIARAARDAAERERQRIAQEEARQQEIAKAQEEAKTRREAEQRRLAEQRRQEEQRRIEEARQQAEQRRLEEQRRQEALANAAKNEDTQAIASSSNPANNSTVPVNPDPANASGEDSGSDPTVIPAALLDGGKVEYVQKVKPDIPRTWDYGGFSLIQAECIVNEYGLVESVTLTTPSPNKRLNSIIEETLKKYKYKPATYQGQPVRFKVDETINFTKFR